MARILLVEDNPITGRMLRIVLAEEGHSVTEADCAAKALAAADGSLPDLVVQDLVLPDMDGMELLAGLRDRAGPALPVIVVSGLAARLESLRAQAMPATMFLTKPVGADRLAAAVAQMLGPSATPPTRPAGRVVLVDADPLRRKMTAAWLRQAGADVEVLDDLDGVATVAARLAGGVLVVESILDHTDGFELSRRLRSDAGACELPIVVLCDPEGIDDARALAATVGALPAARGPHAARQASAWAAMASSAAAAPRSGDFASLHVEWLRDQVRRQSAHAAELARRAALQAAALSYVSGISQRSARPEDIARALGDVLVHCLDAAGLSTGLLYLVHDGRLHLETTSGLDTARRDAARRFFGHGETLLELVRAGQPVPLPGAGVPAALADDALRGLAQRSVLIVPFVLLGRPYGAIVLCSDVDDLAEASWLGFGRTLAAQFGQSVALGDAVARLGRSEAQYRLLFETNPHPMWVYDVETLAFLAVNDAAVEHYGWSRDEFLAMKVTQIRPPEDLTMFLEVNRAGAMPTAFRERWRHRRRDGAVIDVEVSANGLTFAGRRARLVLAHDVTARKALEDQLRQSQKMEAVGRLAGGVAHDFNNLLGVIIGYGDMLMREIGPGTRSSHRVSQMLQAADRAAGLTRQLLAFSRRQILQPRVLDLNDVVHGVVRLLHRVLGEDVRLETATRGGIAKVKVDAGQMEQVLMNLAVNARDAMPGGGRILVETDEAEIDDTFARHHPDAAPGRYVRLTVTDTGEGMDEHVLAHVFEPFFTTKPEGQGTGLGLATVYGIVRQSGGHVTVYSEPGRGTTFRIYLPPADAGELAASVTPDAPPAGGTERILVVEDAPALREIVTEILEGAGYTVVAAESADGALQLARGDGTIHLLLTDVVLPGMGGRELAQTIGTQQPAMRVLFMSGYTDEALGRHGVLDPSVQLITKPFTAAALLRRLREVLDTPEAPPREGA